MKFHKFKIFKPLTFILALSVVLAACGTDPQVQPLPAENTNNSAGAGENSSSQAEESQEAPSQEAGEDVGGSQFEVTASETEARFIVDEVLLGRPKTVVGATNRVEGQIFADYADTSTAHVALTVDLSTLKTDDDRRNKAIYSSILQTDDPANRFAVFESTQIFGLPESVEVGASYKVQITGLLTVKQTTEQVTFEGSITVVSEDRLEGSFTLSIPYTTYTTIPRLPPSVASVDEETSLEIDFVVEK